MGRVYPQGNLDFEGEPVSNQEPAKPVKELWIGGDHIEVGTAYLIKK